MAKQEGEAGSDMTEDFQSCQIAVLLTLYDCSSYNGVS